MTHADVILDTLVRTICSRCWMGGGWSPLLTSRGHVLTGTSVIFGCYRVDMRVIHAWRGCLRVHPNKKCALVSSSDPSAELKIQLNHLKVCFLKRTFVGLFLVLKVAGRSGSASLSGWSRFLKLGFHIHVFFCWLPFSCPAITFPSTHHSQIFLQSLTDKSNQEAVESKLFTHLWSVW